MANAQTPTAVSLDQFAQLMDVHPIIFNGLQGDEGVIMGDQTTRPLHYQYSWQFHESLGREAIAHALSQAETAIELELGAYLRPTWISSEKVWRKNYALYVPQTPGYMDTEALERAVLYPRRGQVLAGGIEARAVLSASAALTYADLDGDDVEESWSLTVSGVTTVTDTREVEVYFVADDRMGDTSYDERWRIRPVQITLDGTTLTIKGKRWQVATPALYEKPDMGLDDGINYNDADNFVTHLAVIRHYTDATTPYVNFYWLDGTAASEGYFVQQGANSVIPYIGEYSNGAWVKTEDFPTTADQFHYLTMQYQSGLQVDANGNVPRPLALAIVHFALGFLPDEAAQVVPSEKVWNYFRREPSEGKGGTMLGYTPEEFKNPFGTWRGAMEAWRYISALKRDFEHG
jgi:hypothetical protein